MNTKEINILYIDDEVHNLNAFKASFLAAEDIHIILTDQRMPNMTGVEFLASILETYPDPIRILLTGYSDLTAVVDAINKGQVYLYITKPWQEEELRQNLEKAFEVFDLRRQNKQLTENLLVVNSQLEFMLRQKLIS